MFNFWRLTVGFTVIYGGKPSAAGQAEPSSTDSGPHEPSWHDYRRTFYIYIANRKSQMLFVGKSELELALWATVPDAAPLLTISHCQYEPLITVMWRRRYLSTVINSAICDWSRMCTTLIMLDTRRVVILQSIANGGRTSDAVTSCLCELCHVNQCTYVNWNEFQECRSTSQSCCALELMLY